MPHQNGEPAFKASEFRSRCVRCTGKARSVSAIVRQTGFDRRTIAKWIRADALPQRNAAAPKTTSPRYFEEYLARRWAEGCVRGRRLFQEVKARGYTGSFSNVERLLAKWRNPKRKTPRPAPPPPRAPAVDPATGRLISPIVAAALCVKPRALVQTFGINATKRSETLRGSCGENSIPDFGCPVVFDAKLSEFELTFPDPMDEFNTGDGERGVRNRFNPSIGPKRSLIDRWSCSIRLLSGMCRPDTQIRVSWSQRIDYRRPIGIGVSGARMAGRPKIPVS